MKKGNLLRYDMNSSNQLTENVLKEYKKSVGDVVLVAISPRTSIELPAHLSQALSQRYHQIDRKSTRLNSSH